MFLNRAEHVGCQGMEKCLRMKFGPIVMEHHRDIETDIKARRKKGVKNMKHKLNGCKNMLNWTI